MSTLLTNRISVEVTDDEIAKARQCVDGLNNCFPYVKGLINSKRQTLPKMDVTNKVFVEDAYKAARNNRDILPKYFSLEEMERDISGYTKLDEIVMLVSQIAQKLKDTQMLMGSEAYVSALTVYRLFASASRDAVPGADAVYQQLFERFKEQGKKPAPIEETPSDETPA